ncbi:MAG: hypothetical protein U0K81_07815 [Paludibacteraceae bacterium]|nr:hypothetical protein [Paludibacteraceae bacterium]
MKKLFIICALTLISMLNAYAAGQGKFIHVDNTTSKNIKPQLAFYQERVNGEDITTLLVWTTNVNTYYEFTDASRILIRFSDGTMTRLSLDTNKEIKKEKFTKKNANATITYYKTITSYAITPELIEKLQNDIAIVKVRVVFKENDAKDYDIAEGYQTKMASDLKQSYLDASQKNRQSTTDLSDEDF